LPSPLQIIPAHFIAIIESGSFYNLSCSWDINARHERNFQKLLNETSCGNLDCLRTVNVNKLYNVSLKYYDQFLPSIDGDMFKKHPVELWNAGAFIKLPLLMGSKYNMDNLVAVADLSS
jgi:hypothetical protein